MKVTIGFASMVLGTILLAGCGSDTSNTATVAIKNDFNNPAIVGFQPPWTICQSSYRGVSFGQILIGATSVQKDVEAGIDNVLMVAAWDDPTCDPAHSLPIASAIAEETVPGQQRTIAIGMTNHQGPCPPEGVPPIPRALYDRILALWPEYNFKPYDQRTENTQCLP
jgi:hypothetical protein